MNRMRCRHRGAVMVELAIILPVLVILVFGIAELGRALYQQNTLVKAVESGVRYLSRAYAVLDPENNCVELEPGWSTAVQKATNLIVYGNEQGTGAPLLENLDAPGSVEVDTDHLPADTATFPDTCVVRISATATFDTMFYPLFGRREVFPALNASTETRWIGE